MRIEQSAAYTAKDENKLYTVHFDKDELTTDTGKKVPYGSCAGTIQIGRAGNVKYNVWTPAGYVPRGYKPAAKRLLERAALEKFGRML